MSTDKLSERQIAELLKRVPTQLLINNQWVDSSDGGTFQVENPATGEVLATMQSATEDDAKKAMDAAAEAQQAWAQTSPRQRSDILRKAFSLVMERAEEFATLMTLEMGKPLDQARGEVNYGAEYLRWFSEEAVRQYGYTAPTPEGTLRMLTVRKPVGPCYLITPWNFPLAMGTRKIAPAVAAGCTMVVKPAKLTPLTTHYLAQTLLEAGLPAGVLNLVTSAHAGKVSDPIFSDSRLRKVSFTGSTPVGVELLKSASTNVLRTSMELGGNAPFIVFEDADVDKAVEGAIGAKMRNMGEACTAANRFLIHESIADEFAEKFTAAMESIQLGNGLEDNVGCGPMIDAKSRENLQALVRDAVDQGAKVLTGGSVAEGPGYFFQPTVLANVPETARVVREEIFGPVAPIGTFKTEEEAISQANSTEYGLASYVFTSDPDRLWRMSENLEFGLMGFNSGVISNAAAPFGGVKQSGMGREGGVEGIDEYSTIQYIGMGSA